MTRRLASAAPILSLPAPDAMVLTLLWSGAASFCVCLDLLLGLFP